MEGKAQWYQQAFCMQTRGRPPASTYPRAHLLSAVPHFLRLGQRVASGGSQHECLISCSAPTCLQKSHPSDYSWPSRCQILLARESNISTPAPLIIILLPADYLKCTCKYISDKHCIPLHMQMQSIDTKIICIMVKDKGLLYNVVFGVKT